MMMEINEIIEVLQAFKEGKRVSVHSQSKIYRYGHTASALGWLICEIATGTHFEVSREPSSVWFPRFGKSSESPANVATTKEDCDAFWGHAKNYTGAVEFREVLP